MLDLATAAASEMPARRLRMMRPGLDESVRTYPVARSRERNVTARCGNAVALGGDADDLLGLAHEAAAMAAGSALGRSLARNAGPASRPASLCSHTASHAARNGSPVPASRAAAIPASTSPLPP